MDLLGAYNSDSDSDDNSENEAQKSKTTSTMPSSTVPIGKQETKPDSGKTPQTSTVSLKENASKAAKKRGKKMLKLSAVLPEHVWNQLTGATTTGGNGFDADSSGAEESDDGQDNKETMKKSIKNSSTGQKQHDFSSSTATAKDPGLQSLMQELSKSKATPQVGGDSPPEKASRPSSSLGFAFISSAVETTKRKRSQDDTVIDIHAVTASTRAQTSQPQVPSKFSPTVSRASSSIPRPSVSRTVPHRPAAPLPVSRPAAAPVTSYQYHAAPAAAARNGHVGGGGGGGGGKKKLSRKRQMEQMLRAGKLDEVEGDHVVESVASTYQPSEFDSGPSYNAHGVRVVPTSGYNVSTGSTTASTDVSGRQRNKHQLNSLLASAASLEAQRANNPHLGRGATGSGSSHRATAKRKYGW